MTHDVASHLVEQIIKVAPDELYGQMLEEHFKPHLLTMSLHPIANFILQRVISSAHTKEQVMIESVEFFITHNYQETVQTNYLTVYLYFYYNMSRDYTIYTAFG